MQAANLNFSKGVAFAKSNNYSEALKAFSAAIQQNPNKFTSYLNRGCIQCCLGLDQFAIEDFNKVVELEPYEITGYYNRFISNFKSGRKLQAQHDLYIALSLAYMKKGQQTKQIKLLAKALSLVENNPLAHIKRGNLYREQDNNVMAENDYAGALQLDDKNMAALTARALFFRHSNRQQQAQQDIQRIAELTKSQQKNNIVLVPIIAKMGLQQVEADIQSKVKQFTSLRNQIFKKAYQQPVVQQANPPSSSHQYDDQNKLQTTLAQRTQRIQYQDGAQVKKPNNKQSLGQLQDFQDSSSHNVNSSGMMTTTNVDKKQSIPNVLPEKIFQNNQNNLNDSIQDHNIKITVTKIESDQNQEEDDQQEAENTKKEDEDVAEINIQNSENQVPHQVEYTQQYHAEQSSKPELNEQTGDEMYGVQPPKKDQNEEQLQSKKQTDPKEDFIQQENLDYVKSSQDNEFLQIRENPNKKQVQEIVKSEKAKQEEQQRERQQFQQSNRQENQIKQGVQEQQNKASNQNTQLNENDEQNQIVNHQQQIKQDSPQKQSQQNQKSSEKRPIQNDQQQSPQINLSQSSPQTDQNQQENDQKPIQAQQIDSKPQQSVENKIDTEQDHITKEDNQNLNNRNQQQSQVNTNLQQQTKKLQSVESSQAIVKETGQQSQNQTQPKTIQLSSNQQQQKNVDQEHHHSSNQVQTQKYQDQQKIQEQENSQSKTQQHQNNDDNNNQQVQIHEGHPQKLDTQKVEESEVGEAKKYLKRMEEDIILNIDNSEAQKSKNEVDQSEESSQKNNNLLSNTHIPNIQQIQSFQMINSQISSQNANHEDNSNILSQIDQENRLMDSQQIKEQVQNQMKNVESVEYRFEKKQYEENEDQHTNKRDMRNQLNAARLVQSKVDVEIQEQQPNNTSEPIPQTTPTQNTQVAQQRDEVTQSTEHIKKLQIFVESGQLLRDTQWLGKMSPYVLISYNGWQQKTQVLQRVGKAPEWNEVLNFNYSESCEDIVVRIFDKQTFKNDDLVGEKTFKVSQILGDQVIQLNFQNQRSAELTIRGAIKQ